MSKKAVSVKQKQTGGKRPGKSPQPSSGRAIVKGVISSSQPMSYSPTEFIKNYNTLHRVTGGMALNFNTATKGLFASWASSLHEVVAAFERLANGAK